MPNWVTNKVHFDGNKDDIKALRNAVTSKTSCFDFDKITHMPEELSLDSGSPEVVAVSCAVARKNGKNTSKEFETSLAYGRTFEEWADLGDKYIANKEKYGFSTWYDWCWENWGTKWNSVDAYWETNNYVVFDTAWNTPEPIFRKLSEMFPNVTFNVEFADEDVGSNCGTIDYDGNDVSVNYINDFEFACDVLGYDPSEFEDEETENEEHCYE